MATTGTTRKSRKQQALDAELGLIIDEFGRAMWNADREYIGRGTSYGNWIRFTSNMEHAWTKYLMFCKNHPDA